MKRANELLRSASAAVYGPYRIEAERANYHKQIVDNHKAFGLYKNRLNKPALENLRKSVILFVGILQRLEAKVKRVDGSERVTAQKMGGDLAGFLDREIINNHSPYGIKLREFVNKKFDSEFEGRVHRLMRYRQGGMTTILKEYKGKQAEQRRVRPVQQRGIGTVRRRIMGGAAPAVAPPQRRAGPNDAYVPPKESIREPAFFPQPMGGGRGNRNGGLRRLITALRNDSRLPNGWREVKVNTIFPFELLGTVDIPMIMGHLWANPRLRIQGLEQELCKITGFSTAGLKQNLPTAADKGNKVETFVKILLSLRRRCAEAVTKASRYFIHEGWSKTQVVGHINETLGKLPANSCMRDFIKEKIEREFTGEGEAAQICQSLEFRRDEDDDDDEEENRGSALN